MNTCGSLLFLFSPGTFLWCQVLIATQSKKTWVVTIWGLWNLPTMEETKGEMMKAAPYEAWVATIHTKPVSRKGPPTLSRESRFAFFGVLTKHGFSPTWSTHFKWRTRFLRLFFQRPLRRASSNFQRNRLRVHAESRGSGQRHLGADLGVVCGRPRRWSGACGCLPEPKGPHRKGSRINQGS